MKVEISKDERWPDYYISFDSKYADREVSDELVERYKKVQEDYNKMQEELRALINDI